MQRRARAHSSSPLHEPKPERLRRSAGRPRRRTPGPSEDLPACRPPGPFVGSPRGLCRLHRGLAAPLARSSLRVQVAPPPPRTALRSASRHSAAGQDVGAAVAGGNVMLALDPSLQQDLTRAWVRCVVIGDLRPTTLSEGAGFQAFVRQHRPQLVRSARCPRGSPPHAHSTGQEAGVPRGCPGPSRSLACGIPSPWLRTAEAFSIPGRAGRLAPPAALHRGRHGECGLEGYAARKVPRCLSLARPAGPTGLSSRLQTNTMGPPS